MPKPPKVSPKWGSARIAVISLRDEISRDMLAGFPASEIYRRHQDKLGGLTMGAFQRQVRLIVKPTIQSPAAPLAVTGPTNDGHQSPTRTFQHNPEVRKDDIANLLGTPGKPRK